ncbi:MAG: hypothetical protein ACYTXE_20540 [Nostoc sp.]
MWGGHLARPVYAIILFPVGDWECRHWGCRLPYWRQSHQEQHFQPEAGNEVLKEFQLKLTPMGSALRLSGNAIEA